ncbi:MAG: NAD-dependent epimerase/dehydratase family protein [bacterium]|nr:NAD-dependent epimerase/dehydratase family protein [bacterium]
MRIAVTGATGFIGKYLVRRLMKDGHNVRVLCRPGREDALELPEGHNVEVQIGDLTYAASLDGFSKDVDFLVHLASAHDHFEETHMQLVNVKGTENLVEEVRLNGPKSLVFVVVSSAVIGVPVYSYYRDSKRVQEKIVRGASLNWASFRPTLVYGKGDHRHTAPLLRKCGAQKGSYWIYHEGVSMLNPVHIDDVIEALMLFFAHPAAQEDGRIYEIAGPEGISFNDFVDSTIQATGGKVRRRNIARHWVQRALFLKGLFKDVTKERRGAGYFSLHHDHNIEPAKEELGWRPRTFQVGITEVAEGDWWKDEGRGGKATRLGTGGV